VAKRQSFDVKLALRQFRTANDQSLEEVAKGAKTTRGHIWALETKRVKDPRISLLVSIADHFECSVDNLISRSAYSKGKSLSSETIAIIATLERLEHDEQAVALKCLGRLAKAFLGTPRRRKVPEKDVA